MHIKKKFWGGVGQDMHIKSLGTQALTHLHTLTPKKVKIKMMSTCFHLFSMNKHARICFRNTQHKLTNSKLFQENSYLRLI